MKSRAQKPPPSAPGKGGRKRGRKARARKIERAIRSTVLLVALGAAVWLCVCCLTKIARPFRLYIAESSENQRIEREIETYRLENSFLREKARYLKTPDGAENEARTLGWVREGEISIVVEPEDKGKPDGSR